jgi:hypothetical protein
VSQRVFEPIAGGEELYGDTATRLRMWRMSGHATRKRCALQLSETERLEVLSEERDPAIAMRLAESVPFEKIRAITFFDADVRAAAWLGSSHSDQTQFADVVRELAEIDARALSRCLPTGRRFALAQNEGASLVAVRSFDVDALWGMEIANTPAVRRAVWDRLAGVSSDGDELWWCAVTIVEAGVRTDPYARETLARIDVESEALDALDAFLDGRRWKSLTHAGERLAEACTLQWLRCSPEVGLLDAVGLEAVLSSMWSPAGDAMLQNPSLRRDQVPRALADTSEEGLVAWLMHHREVSPEEYVGALQGANAAALAFEELRRVWEGFNLSERRQLVALAPDDEPVLTVLSQFLDVAALREVMGAVQARSVVAILPPQVWFEELLGVTRDVLEMATFVRLVEANPEVLWEDVLAAVAALGRDSIPHPELSIDDSGLEMFVDPPF